MLHVEDGLPFLCLVAGVGAAKLFRDFLPSDVKAPRREPSKGEDADQNPSKCNHYNCIRIDSPAENVSEPTPVALFLL